MFYQMLENRVKLRLCATRTTCLCASNISHRLINNREVASDTVRGRTTGELLMTHGYSSRNQNYPIQRLFTKRPVLSKWSAYFWFVKRADVNSTE